MSIARTAIVDDDGSGLTGTALNNAWKQELYDQIDAALAGSSACVAFHNTTQNAATATVTTLNLNSEDLDVGPMHDLVTNNSRINILTTGKYLVSGIVAYAANATGQRFVQVKNSAGTILTQNILPGSSVVTPNLVATPPWVGTLTAGDYLILVAYQDSGSTLATGDASARHQQNSLSVVRLW